MVAEDGEHHLAGHRARRHRRPARPTWSRCGSSAGSTRATSPPSTPCCRWSGPAAADGAGTLGVTGLAEPDVVAVPGPKFAAGVRAAPAQLPVYDVRPLPVGGWARRVPARGGPAGAPRPALDAVAASCAAPGCRRPGCGRTRRCGWRPGSPGSGCDTDHRTIPAEVDLIAPAVHLDKGCYRGQETVARVHNLGRPPRRLVLLHLDGVATDQLPAAGTPVTLRRPGGRLRRHRGAPLRAGPDRAGRAQAQRPRRRRPCGSASSAAAIDPCTEPGAVAGLPCGQDRRHDDSDVDHGCPHRRGVGQGGGAGPAGHPRRAGAHRQGVRGARRRA